MFHTIKTAIGYQPKELATKVVTYIAEIGIDYKKKDNLEQVVPPFDKKLK